MLDRPSEGHQITPTQKTITEENKNILFLFHFCNKFYLFIKKNPLALREQRSTSMARTLCQCSTVQDCIGIGG